jgi:hypothetical protein
MNPCIGLSPGRKPAGLSPEKATITKAQIETCRQAKMHLRKRLEGRCMREMTENPMKIMKNENVLVRKVSENIEVN